MGLGFYRGINKYNYNYYIELKEYKRHSTYDSSYTKPQYLYVSGFSWGILYGVMYANPFLLPFVISKELYRLEVNIRGINEEKKKYSFYEII
jgi:hypothetical protein